MMALSTASVFNRLSLRCCVKRENSKEARGESPASLTFPHRVSAATLTSASLAFSSKISRTRGDALIGNGCERWRCGRRRGSHERRLVVLAAAENDGGSSKESGEVDVEALEARLGLGRRARKQQQQAGKDGSESKASSSKPKTPASTKSWESMTFAEKAWSLYIDPEKGILFWLNKLAYGAIYTIIGAWIVFRFIGPALGWYQLDQPLLAPDKIFEGSP